MAYKNRFMKKFVKNLRRKVDDVLCLKKMVGLI